MVVTFNMQAFLNLNVFLSYRLDDLLLFSPDVYYRSLGLYNEAMWPGQIVAFLLGCFLFGLSITDRRLGLGVSLISLSLAFAISGGVYHLRYYLTLNWMAFYYGLLFLAEALFLLIFGLICFVKRPRPAAPAHGMRWWLGAGLMVFGLAITPLFGLIDGPSLSGGLVFGLHPLPSLLVLFGLAFLQPRFHGFLLALPMVYVVIGGLTAYVIGSVQLVAYVVLLIAGLAYCFLAGKAVVGRVKA